MAVTASLGSRSDGWRNISENDVLTGTTNNITNNNTESPQSTS